MPDAPCRRCAGALGPGADPAACDDCARLRPKFTRTVAAARYAGLVGELIRRAKYGRDPLLAVPLADLMRRAVRAGDSLRDADGASLVDIVLAAPANPRHARERAFHLADLIAESVAADLRVRCRTDWFVRVGNPEPQAALPRTERRKAARGTVALRRARRFEPTWKSAPAPRGLRVLVVDDVLTTGATVNECARVLLAAGAAEVRVAVVSRA